MAYVIIFVLIFQYKLFLNKLQKSICHAEFELSRFQKNSLYNGNSSFFESILSHRIDKISDYTYSEWEEILKNLKSSFKFMEQIIVRDNSSYRAFFV